MSANSILRAGDVSDRTGLSRITIWRKVRAGDFPAPRQLGAHSIGWLESEVDDWLTSLPAVNYAPPADCEAG